MITPDESDAILAPYYNAIDQEPGNVNTIMGAAADHLEEAGSPLAPLYRKLHDAFYNNARTPEHNLDDTLYRGIHTSKWYRKPGYILIQHYFTPLRNGNVLVGLGSIRAQASSRGEFPSKRAILSQDEAEQVLQHLTDMHDSYAYGVLDHNNETHMGRSELPNPVDHLRRMMAEINPTRMARKQIIRERVMNVKYQRLATARMLTKVLQYAKGSRKPPKENIPTTTKRGDNEEMIRRGLPEKRPGRTPPSVPVNPPVSPGFATPKITAIPSVQAGNGRAAIAKQIVTRRPQPTGTGWTQRGSDPSHTVHPSLDSTRLAVVLHEIKNVYGKHDSQLSSMVDTALAGAGNIGARGGDVYTGIRDRLNAHALGTVGPYPAGGDPQDSRRYATRAAELAKAYNWHRVGAGLQIDEAVHDFIKSITQGGRLESSNEAARAVHNIFGMGSDARAARTGQRTDAARQQQFMTALRNHVRERAVGPDSVYSLSAADMSDKMLMRSIRRLAEAEQHREMLRRGRHNVPYVGVEPPKPAYSITGKDQIRVRPTAQSAQYKRAENVRRYGLFSKTPVPGNVVNGIRYTSHPNGKYDADNHFLASMERNGLSHALVGLKVIPGKLPTEGMPEYDKKVQQATDKFLERARHFVQNNPNDALTKFYDNSANRLKGVTVPDKTVEGEEISPLPLGVLDLSSAIGPLVRHLSTQAGLREDKHILYPEHPHYPEVPPEPNALEPGTSEHDDRFRDLLASATGEDFENIAAHILSHGDAPQGQEQRPAFGSEKPMYEVVDTPDVTHEDFDLPQLEGGPSPDVRDIEASRRPPAPLEQRRRIQQALSNHYDGAFSRGETDPAHTRASAMQMLQSEHGLSPQQARLHLNNFTRMQGKPAPSAPPPTKRVWPPVSRKSRNSVKRYASSDGQRPDSEIPSFEVNPIQQEPADDPGDDHEVQLTTTYQPYAWPGGYPLVHHHIGSGSTLCTNCANIFAANNPSEPQLVSEPHYEGPPQICDDCGTSIESAYGDPNDEQPTQMARLAYLRLLYAKKKDPSDDDKSAYVIKKEKGGYGVYRSMARNYHVAVDESGNAVQCNCPDHFYRKRECKHMKWVNEISAGDKKEEDKGKEDTKKDDTPEKKSRSLGRSRRFARIYGSLKKKNYAFLPKHVIHDLATQSLEEDEYNPQNNSDHILRDMLEDEGDPRAMLVRRDLEHRVDPGRYFRHMELAHESLTGNPHPPMRSHKEHGLPDGTSVHTTMYSNQRGARSHEIRWSVPLVLGKRNVIYQGVFSPEEHDEFMGKLNDHINAHYGDTGQQDTGGMHTDGEGPVHHTRKVRLSRRVINEIVRKYAKSGELPQRLSDAYNNEFRRRANEIHDSLPEEQKAAHQPALDEFNKLDHFGLLTRLHRGDTDGASDAAQRMLWGKGDEVKSEFFDRYNPDARNLTARFISWGKHLARPEKTKEVPISSLGDQEAAESKINNLSERVVVGSNLDDKRSQAIAKAKETIRNRMRTDPEYAKKRSEAAKRAGSVRAAARKSESTERYKELKGRYDELVQREGPQTYVSAAKKLGVTPAAVFGMHKYFGTTTIKRTEMLEGRKQDRTQRWAEIESKYNDLVKELGYTPKLKEAAEKLGVKQPLLSEILAKGRENRGEEKITKKVLNMEEIRDKYNKIVQEMGGKAPTMTEAAKRLGISLSSAYKALGKSKKNYAAYRAPAGGMVARGTHYKGGEMVPDMGGKFMNPPKKYDHKKVAAAKAKWWKRLKVKKLPNNNTDDLSMNPPSTSPC